MRGSAGACPTSQNGWVRLEVADPAADAVGNSGWLSGLLSGVQGSFSFDAAAWAAYDHVAIGFQSGGSRSNPDCVVFDIADMTIAELWTISAQTVGYAVLYGMNDAVPTVLSAPTSGSLALAAVAFAGLMLTRPRARRRIQARPDAPDCVRPAF